MKRIFLYLCMVFSVLVTSAQNNINTRNQQCLNGWWDFQPVLTNEGTHYSEPKSFPKEGWINEGILVPGSWKSYSSEDKSSPLIWNQWSTSTSFNFPELWNTTKTAWYRRSFSLEKIDPESNYFLIFEGILRESWIFVNGKEVGHRKEGSLPSEHDITRAIKPGVNEILVYVTDYKRDENGHAFVNVGADQIYTQFGIWNNVYLEIRPNVRISDITIRTSTRKSELTVLYTLVNNSKKTVKFQPVFNITANNIAYLQFTDESIKLLPGEIKDMIRTVSWKGYIPWSPSNPQLYYLNYVLKGEKGIYDAAAERFGFREIWIEGHNIMLNGNVIHLFGEWGHKNHFDFFRPEYVRQWYGMLKDLNMNYIRTHTFPHPEFMIDMADEMGILVCLESAWFFSYEQAMDKEEYWQNAREYAHDIVNTYKNHPSVIFWSSGNEVRWGWDINAVIKNGPEVEKVYQEMDPTRVVYSEGSTSLWDERKQPLISRHYGLECTGEEFWDKSKPLLVGEFGKWHYGQPIDNLIWGNDEVFASFNKCATAIAREAADIILQARSNEVACLFPWNISCLDNYRPSGEEMQHKWGDYTAPFAKPLRTGPYATEFAWWQPESKGYIPGAGFELIKHAMRPFAIYIRERLNQIFDDEEIVHTVNLINDLGQDISGNIEIEVFVKDEKVKSILQKAEVKSGGTLKKRMAITVPKVNKKELAIIKTSFVKEKTIVDSVTREVWITPSSEKSSTWYVGQCMVFGNGEVQKLLSQHGIKTHVIINLDTILDANIPLLLIEKNSILAGSNQNQVLKSYIEKGGKVMILEQDNSAMPDVLIESKPSESAFIRTYKHELMDSFTNDEFNYWGNDPYGKSNSESWVVIKPYLKPASSNSTILLDCGSGDFGSGGLNWTPLFETRYGKGLAIVSQLRVSDKADRHPSALKLIKLSLQYLSAYKPKATNNLAVLDNADSNKIDLLGFRQVAQNKANVLLISGNSYSDKGISANLKQQINNGATLIVHNVDSACIKKIATNWSIDLQPVNLGPVYNLIRENNHQLLNGISNQETYWLDSAQYTPIQNKNVKMDNWMMRASKGISVLQNETESCWREFYTKGAMSELLRMPVITYYLYNNTREKASGMMQFNTGKGQLIITQIPLENDYIKSKIFWSQLLTNLGIDTKNSLFDGEKVVAGAQKSNGYPDSVRYIKNPTKELLAQIISKGNPGETSERFTNQGISDGFSWEWIPSPGGEINLPADCKEAIIYFELNPGRPRKLTEVTGGLPDPSQQTILDLTGKGKAILYVNGVLYQPVLLNGIKTNIPDINLNQFWNTILIHFDSQGTKLNLMWRNRQNQPELEFLFD
jgi:beta-galactosidase